VTRWLRFRFYLVGGLLTALFAGLGWKAFALQLREGARLTEMARTQHQRDVSIPPPRGTIRDAQGAELAVSVDVDSAFANPPDVVDVAGTAQLLAKALRMDVRDVEARLASPRQFEWLKRRLTPEEAVKVKALDLPGVGLAREPRRFYPGRSLAATLLGGAGLDGNGLDGLELSLETELAGKQQKVPVLKDRRGRVVLGLESSNPESVAGATVTLTIDRFIQFSAERALAEGVEKNDAKAGIVVVLDARTAEVLAMASYPTFDANLTRKSPDARNRAVVDAYEPGSIMKVFSYSSAIEAGVARPDMMIDVEGGKIQIGNRTIADTHKGEHVISLTQAFAQSSNVAAVKLARRMGREVLSERLLAFGFGQKSGIELPGERRGTLHDVKKWGDAELSTIAYGYGMTATPLQIAAALVPIANGGTWYPPHVVSSIIGADGVARPREARPEPRRALSEQTAAHVRKMMIAVMEDGGTGDAIKVPGFRVAGKTGTAYKHDPERHGYSRDRYLSSFLGFAPADDPRIVILVMMDEPRGGEHYGGKVAGPVFGRLAGETLQYLGVPSDAPVVASTPIAAAAVVEDPPEEPTEPALPLAAGFIEIPDFKGLGLGDAMALARQHGVSLQVTGSGRAIKQFPPPGRARKSITCRVTFDPG
jgi:cell division protein FtsI (penicillin-binding protein 3)